MTNSTTIIPIFIDTSTTPRKYERIKVPADNGDHFKESLAKVLEEWGYPNARYDRGENQIVYDRDRPFSLEGVFGTLFIILLATIVVGGAIYFLESYIVGSEFWGWYYDTINDKIMRLIGDNDTSVAIGLLFVSLLGGFYTGRSSLTYKSISFRHGRKYLYVTFDVSGGGAWKDELLDDLEDQFKIKVVNLND